MDFNDGLISGTPSVLSDAVEYVITVTELGNEASIHSQMVLISVSGIVLVFHSL